MATPAATAAKAASIDMEEPGMLRAADTGSVPAAGASADLLVVLSLVAGSVAAMEVAVGAAAASAGGRTVL